MNLPCCGRRKAVKLNESPARQEDSLCFESRPVVCWPCWCRCQYSRPRISAALSSDSGFSVAMHSALDPSGVLLWPGAPVVLGRVEVRRLLDARPGNSPHLTWQPLDVELARDSALGVTWGVLVEDSQHLSAPLRIGRYISVWRRTGNRWTIAALALIGAPGDTTASGGLPPTRPPVRASTETGPFIQADLAFARLAGDSGAAAAFRAWAAHDVVIFGGRGILIRGPEAVGRAVSGPERWRWHPVAAGSAQSGDLGWTVGEAVIAGSGQPSYSKYLTVWRRQGGATRFLVDGGNTRPPIPGSF
jgi:hypothetical protein